MKNVKNAHYYQIDNEVLNIRSLEGVEVLKANEAYKKYYWLKKYFSHKPKEGYFVWVKKQPLKPLMICVVVSQKKINQKLENLLIIEKGITVEFSASCSALASGLCASHYAQGKIILKEGASLSYQHLHSWGQQDDVEPNYEFILEKGAKLNYFYQLLNSPKEITFKTKILVGEKASANLNIVMKGKNTVINVEEEMNLMAKNAQGTVRLRLVAEKNSRIKAINKLVAQDESRGHLECQGLNLDQHSSIELIPALINKNKNSLLTHEAAIGRINQEEINYLRSRGLTKKQAINLIINGFLHFNF